MPQSYASVTLHIVFSTKGRKRYLDDKIRNELFAYLAGICNNSQCQVIAVGGHDDHVHIACMLNRTVTIAWLVENLKKEFLEMDQNERSGLRTFRLANRL